MPKVLTDKVAAKHKITRKAPAKKTSVVAAPTAKPKEDPVQTLVVTVADLVKTTTETNKNAIALIDQMAIRIGTEDTKVPEIIFPEAAKKWRFKVIKRDNNGFLDTVDAERME